MRYNVVADNGSQYGPADLATLQLWVDQGRVLPYTTVVEEASGNRREARMIPGLVFKSTMGTPPIGGTTAPPYAGYHRQTTPVDFQTPLIKAIFSALCCCLIPGIVAIVYSAQASSYARMGNYSAANEAVRTADTWANWAIGLGLVSTVCWLAINFAALGN